MAESDWLLDLHVVSMVRGSLSTPSTSSSWVLSELSIKLIESISRLSRFVTKSFVGRDFKAFIQMAVFVVSPYISQEELKCWILLSKVMHSLLLSIKLFFFTSLGFSNSL